MPRKKSRHANAIALDADALIKKGKSDHTEKAYLSGLRHFEEDFGGTLPTTAATLERYIVQYQTELTPGTLRVRLWAIKRFHAERKLPDPTDDTRLDELLVGLRKEYSVAPDQAKPLLLEDLRRVVDYLDGCLHQALAQTSEKEVRRLGMPVLRDRALFLMGFWLGLRSDDIANLQIERITREDTKRRRRLRVYVPKSKGDRLGKGRDRWLGDLADLCPVRAYEDWITSAELTSGPVFRAVDRYGHVRKTGISSVSIIEIMRRVLLAAGFTESEVAEYSSHSFRRGLATSWLEVRGDGESLTHHVGWRDTRTALGYQDQVRMLPEELMQMHFEKEAPPQPIEPRPPIRLINDLNP